MSMTNAIVILSAVLLQTNIFMVGASNRCGGWGRANSWNAEVRFVAPSAGTCVIESTSTAEGARRVVDTIYGETWTAVNGSFTNSAGTNVTRFPIPPFDNQYFRIKQL